MTEINESWVRFNMVKWLGCVATGSGLARPDAGFSLGALIAALTDWMDEKWGHDSALPAQWDLRLTDLQQTHNASAAWSY